jgi:hypothetical protein
MRKIVLVLMITLLVLANTIFANDGVFYVRGNNLIPLQETQVELRKEILKFYIRDFKWMDVDVDFTFYNPGGEKTVTVGFVTPPAFGDISAEDERHPRIKNFTVKVNGENLQYEMKRMKDTSFQSANSEINGYDFVYFFPVTFKKGLNKIRHTYRFQGGGSVETQRDFSYQITTGKRWANKQIDDFELQIHPDLGIFYIPLSFTKDKSPANWKIVGKGTLSKPQRLFDPDAKPEARLVQLQSGYISLREKNFKPDQDITLGEFNWVLGWSDRMCRDRKKCFVPEEIESNPLAYFTVNPVRTFSGEHLNGLSKKNLRIARNFPYAIRGYDFKTKMLQRFYSQFFWYQPDKSLKMEDINLSEAERVFIEKAQNVENTKP